MLDLPWHEWALPFDGEDIEVWSEQADREYSSHADTAPE